MIQAKFTLCGHIHVVTTKQRWAQQGLGHPWGSSHALGPQDQAWKLPDPEYLFKPPGKALIPLPQLQGLASAAHPPLTVCRVQICELVGFHSLLPLTLKVWDYHSPSSASRVHWFHTHVAHFDEYCTRWYISYNRAQDKEEQACPQVTASQWVVRIEHLKSKAQTKHQEQCLP